ncbi:MAG: acyl carrier protein [Clostridia bacterium]|nr:acyl carrier protein [Clostridia bacterium]
MLEKLQTLICDYVDIEPSEITSTAELRGDLNLNSMDLVNLAVALEDDFDIRITDKEMASLYTVGDLCTFVEGKA